MKRMLLACLVAGCAATPSERFYVLAPADGAPVATAAATPSILVAPAAVPEMVDRTPMVIRTGPNQVDIEEFHRWAEPLKHAISRVVAANLSRELGGARVASGRLGGDFDYRVAIDVGRFDSSLAAGAVIEASWTVTPKAGAPIRGQTVAREAAGSGDYAGIAGAHSRALERLAKEIAAAIARGPSTPPPRAPGG